MERYLDMDAVSDGKRYGLNDMVKAGCNDCKGCSACCRGMGNSIVLDPLDVYRLETGLGMDFSGLLSGAAELGVEDGVILPHLKMAGEKESCVFLNKEGRCSIHAHRPGFCRIFPLGRIYEEDGFRYFLQVRECPMENKTKVKVKKWIDTPDIKRNEQFILQWHDYIKALRVRLKRPGQEETAKNRNLEMLNTFFVRPYRADGDFYREFEERLNEVLKDPFFAD